MAYLPPAPLNFDFSEAYPGTLDFEFLLAGTNQSVVGRGADSSEFGGHDVRNAGLGIAPVGHDSAVFGDTCVYPLPAASRTIPIDGIAPPPLGIPFVTTTLAFDFVTPIQAPSAGDALHFQFTPDGGERQLYPPGLYAFGSGLAKIEHSPFVRPVGFDATLWGELTRIDNRSDLEQDVGPLGWDSTEFGRTSIGRALIFVFGPDLYVPPTPSLPFNFISRLDYPQYAFLNGFGIDSFDYGRTTWVSLYQTYTRPYGFDSFDTGYPLVTHRIRFVDLNGYGPDTSVFGTAGVFNLQLGIQLTGFVALNMGFPRVENTRRFVYQVGGPDTSAFGLAKVVLGTQYVEPLGWGSLSFEPADESTLPQVTHELRFISFDQGLDFLRMGDAWVSFRVRYVVQEWTSAHTHYGIPDLSYTPEVRLIGFDASSFGEPELRFGNVLMPSGFDALETSGQHVVDYWTRYVHEEFWTERDEFGLHLVYNLRQYVDVIQLWSSDLFGYDPVVSNRNRTVSPEQFFPPNISRNHQIRLLGTQATPSAGDQSAFGEHLVAFRIRTVYPEPVRFAGFVDKYHFVHNSAAQALPLGIDSLRTEGRHVVWFNAQHIDTPRYANQDGYGRPFVSFRIRELQHYDATFGFKMGNAWVNHNPRPVVPTTEDPMTQYGRPVVVSHVNRITAFPMTTYESGYARIRNVTPQLYPLMGQMLEVSDPWVSRSPRFIVPTSISEMGVGRSSWAFRDRTSFVPGFDTGRIGGHRIFRDGPDPPTNRFIVPEGINPIIPSLVGVPKVQGPPHSMGWDSLEMSDLTWVRVQGCSPYWEAPDSLFGFGVPFIQGTRYVRHVQVQDATLWPTTYARVSPHTIWCRHDTPQQAIDNNPQSLRRWHDMDTIDGSGPHPPWFGDAYVATPHTVEIRPFHHPQETHDMVGGWVGFPSLQGTIRYIILDDGIYSFKSGFPKLPGKQKSFSRDWDSLEFGEHKIEAEPLDEQYLFPKSWDSFTTTKAFIEHKNRQIYPQGNLHTAFGNNFPMVYHYPRGPKGVSGTDMSEFGEGTWVSHRIREIFPEGHDSFEDGFTPGMFDSRMKVTKGPASPYFSVGDTAIVGFPDVSHGQGGVQYIRPYMIPPPQYCEPHSVEEG